MSGASAGTAGPRGRRRTLVLTLVALISLIALGWQVTRDARESWWPSGPHAALGAGESLDGVQVELVAIEPAARVLEWDTVWSPPEGFQPWRISLAVTTTQDEYSFVTTLVESADGRLFEAGQNVPLSSDDYEWSLSVSAPEPGEDPIPEVQHLLVLLPEDAEPAAVRIEEVVRYPEYIRLEVEQ
ncbi:hypothetical protein IM660_02860 [Ruania alkalisoli]|uniref:Uncharacterized protein n=1 Tax=Ruania alkalisoli TaxID=2779775 RepID=A0A7M1SWZ7_9MICO|nr:hypothetical protein [Ruania alkalisoli]QOR71262.1 hypothetical protein IM660_02860 [Ruania alkalisoli]